MTLDVLASRAQQLLQLLLDKGLRVSIPNLEATARRTFNITEDEVQRVAAHAWQVRENGRRDDEPNPDWPVRSVAKPKPHPAPPPAPAARAPEPEPERKPEPPVAPQNRKRNAITRRVLEELEKIMPAHPNATAAQLFQLVKQTGIEMCQAQTFMSCHVPRVRRQLGMSGRNRGGRKPSAAPAEAQKVDLGAWRKHRPDAKPAPEPTQAPPSIALPAQLSKESMGDSSDEIRVSGGGDTFVDRGDRVAGSRWHRGRRGVSTPARILAQLLETLPGDARCGITIQVGEGPYTIDELRTALVARHPRVITTGQAAQVFGWSTDTWARWAQAGEIDGAVQEGEEGRELAAASGISA